MDTPEITDRELVRTRGDHGMRRAYHQRVAALKADMIEERRRLGQAYLAEHADWDARTGGLVSQASGMGAYDYRGLAEAQATLAECHALIAARGGENLPSKGSVDFIASAAGRDIGPESATVAFALHPAMLCPVIRYLGVLPILFAVGINRARAEVLLTKSSHMFHLDPEDTTQLKAFMYLVDVDQDTRPFHALPADLSAQVLERTGYCTGRLPDEAVAEIVGPDRAVPALGPAGTVTFCDTNRCFHFGGRPGLRDREMLVLHYALPTSTWFPACEGDGERRNLTPLLRPDSRAPYWNALVGGTLC